MYLAQAYAASKEGDNAAPDSEDAKAFKEAMEKAASNIGQYETS